MDLIKRTTALPAIASITALAIWLVFFAVHAYAWSDFDTEGVDCDIFPAGEGLSAATWGSQAKVQTANNANQDCDLMYVSGYYHADGEYESLTPIWAGFVGPAYNIFDNVDEVYGSHNICQSGYTHCNGYESTHIYKP
ncbi:MAG: hypothetical protein KC482_04145 [Dehalococcoidia bacterium]|nr:hypothetical protein [Dehalococcoidia bacterium]MCA9845675.1 hypothetical protein [Dehalococcoidia bacterium]MCA9852774.1 hypothetical protein [Dehalococcoidia bacterium]